MAKPLRPLSHGDAVKAPAEAIADPGIALAIDQHGFNSRLTRSRAERIRQYSEFRDNRNGRVTALAATAVANFSAIQTIGRNRQKLPSVHRAALGGYNFRQEDSERATVQSRSRNLQAYTRRSRR